MSDYRITVFGCFPTLMVLQVSVPWESPLYKARCVCVVVIVMDMGTVHLQMDWECVGLQEDLV